MKIITIIPAYNEEAFVNQVAEDAKNYSDVLVVDDGSTDKTIEKALLASVEVVSHSKNNGKGAAIKSGIKYAINHNYEAIVILDGDGQHNPIFIPDLLTELETSHIVIGSRFLNNNSITMPWQRKLSNSLTTALIRYMTGYHITDSQSGFRAFTNEAAQVFLEIPYNDYIYESEMIYQASKRNFILKEKSINSSYGEEKSYVRTRHVLHYLIFIIKNLIRKIRRGL